MCIRAGLEAGNITGLVEKLGIWGLEHPNPHPRCEICPSGVPVGLTFSREIFLPRAITVCTQENPNPALECPWRVLQLQAGTERL